jgi:hypothetical protein
MQPEGVSGSDDPSAVGDLARAAARAIHSLVGHFLAAGDELVEVRARLVRCIGLASL